MDEEITLDDELSGLVKGMTDEQKENFRRELLNSRGEYLRAAAERARAGQPVQRTREEEIEDATHSLGRYHPTDARWQAAQKKLGGLLTAQRTEHAEAELRAAIRSQVENGKLPHGDKLKALARRLDELTSEPIQQAVAASLKGIGQSACVDAIWQEWLHSRSARLTEVLLAVQKPATAPPQTRAYSLLKLGRIKQLEDAPADLVMALILACDDPDEQLAGTARQVIGHLRQEDAFEILCAHWALTRNPFLEATILKAGYLAQNPVNVRVLTALKLNQPDQIPTGSPEVVAPLIAASRDADAEIAARAGYLLRHALSGAALTEFCLQWSRSREPDLEAILVESSLVPRQPPPLRLLCALKTGNLEIPRNCPPRSLEFLMNACQDADAVIQHNARSALRALQAQESREAVCQLFLSGGHLEARQIALDAGYLPAKQEDRALFLFLTEQWHAAGYL